MCTEGPGNPANFAVILAQGSLCGQKWEAYSWKSSPSTLPHNCSQPYSFSRAGNNQCVFFNLQPLSSAGWAKRKMSVSKFLQSSLKWQKKKNQKNPYFNKLESCELSHSFEDHASAMCCCQNMQAVLEQSAVLFRNQRLLVHARVVICGLCTATVNQPRREYHLRAMRKGREHERDHERLSRGFGIRSSTIATVSWKCEICKKAILRIFMLASSNRKG